MSQFAVKFRLIFLPFVYITVCAICIYTFLNWLLIIKLKAFAIDQDIINFFIPAIFIVIPLVIWLRPRLKLLKFKNTGRHDPLSGYIMLAFITILAPMAIVQMYMVTATGKLTRLDNINQINNFPATKYYTARHFYVSKGFSHFRFTFVVSGKSKSDFDMYIYAAVPVFDHLFPDTNQIAAIRTGANANVLIFIDNKLSNMQRLKKLTADSIRMMRYLNPSFVMPKYGDAGKYGAIAVVTKQYKMKFNQPEMKISPAAWLAVKYIKTISNSLSLPEKENLYKVFTAECDADFKHLQLNKFIYLNRLSYNNRDLKNYVTAIKLKGDVIGNEPIILLPVFEPFANRNGNKLLWIFGSFVIGAGVFLITLQFTPLRDIDFDNLNHAAIIARER